MKLAKSVINEVLNSSNIFMVLKSVNKQHEMDAYAVIGLRTNRATKVLVPIKGDKYRPIEVSTKINLSAHNILAFGEEAEIAHVLKDKISYELFRASYSFYMSLGRGKEPKASDYVVKVKKDHGWMTREEYYMWLIKKGVLAVIIKHFHPEMANVDVSKQALKHGDLELIGFDEKKHSKLIDIFDESEKAMKKAGFKGLSYGKVFLVPKAKAGGRATFADYVEKDDTIRVFDYATTHTGSHPVKTFVHEVGHRYYYKKLSTAGKQAVANKYYEALRASSRKMADEEVQIVANGGGFKVGDRVTHHKYGEMEYAGVGGRSLNARKLTHNFYIIKDGKKTSKFMPFDSMIEAVKYFNTLAKQAGEATTGDMWLPTNYSKTNAVEWFAEIFSYSIVDGHKEITDWIKGLK